MPVSVTGSSRLSLSKLKAVSALAVVTAGLGLYAYGPALSPMARSAAVEKCNEVAGGNFRSYRLGWEVGVRPHWSCRDARDPTAQPVDLGWWASPEG